LAGSYAMEAAYRAGGAIAVAGCIQFSPFQVHVSPKLVAWQTSL
jgi:hypothetical protein